MTFAATCTSLSGPVAALGPRSTLLARFSAWLQTPAPRRDVDALHREVAQVRALAEQARHSNPGYAADLDAALARFEAERGMPR